MFHVGDSTSQIAGRRRRVIIIVASAALAVTIGIIVVLAAGGSGKADAMKDDGSAPPPRHAIAPATPDAATAVTAATPDAAIAAPPPVAADAAAPSCFANVSSVPDGVDVSLDDGPTVAQTPARVQVPCGAKVKINFKKAPLQAQVRVVTGTSDDITVAKVTLAKALGMVTLRVSSSPQGASITVNGKPMGATPTVVKVLGGESSTIVLAKDGYDPDTERVTPRANNQLVTAKLKKKK